MKNEIIFCRKWPSTGHLDSHLSKSLSITLVPNKSCQGPIVLRTTRVGLSLQVFLAIWGLRNQRIIITDSVK